jgi:hypothetical protein
MLAYTYLLTHVPTGKRYYGVRYSKKADPLELWVTYFSSSRYVKALPREEFTAEVRKTFSDPKDALVWEQTVIRRLRADEREDWLNKHYSGGTFHPSERTKEHTDKIAASNRGQKRTRTWTLSEETKKRMSEAARKRTPPSDETRVKISAAVTGKKYPTRKPRKSTPRSEAFREKQRLGWIERRKKFGPNGRGG